MDKTAQREGQTGRGFFNKLRETINMPGKVFDGVFRKELENVMLDVKDKDDNIRAVFTGKTIGNAMPTDNTAIKDILKSARRNFNRREYMPAVIDLGHFHKKLLEASNFITELKVDVDQIHHKFLFQGLKDTGYDTKLDSFRQHMQNLQTAKASYSPEHFVKEAGMLDDLMTFLSRRGRGLMAWEKRYPQKIKALRDGAEGCISEAEKIFETSLGNLKGMATARATRRPDEYIEVANKMKADFAKFDLKFRDFYAKAVNPWLQIKDQVEAKEKAEAEQSGTGSPAPGPQAAAPTGPTGEMVAPKPSTGTPPMGGGFLGLVPQGGGMGVAPLGSNPPGSSPPFAPPAPAPQEPALEEVDTGPVTERNPKPPVHAAFYHSLEALGNESPKVLAKYISRYAASIQASDPETAIELFKVSRRING